MSYLVINGGRKLKGEITNQASKNSAIAILCACAKIKGKNTIKDVPEIEEVSRIIKLLTSIGVKVEKTGSGILSVDASRALKINRLDRAAAATTRASLLLLGALSDRVKNYKLYKSGGCKLGQRTVRPHLFALQKMGMSVVSKDKYYEVKGGDLRGAHIVMYESGDTALENTIMAAVTAKGETVIKMASANYMVQDLCYFLNRAGAKISGIGSTTLRVSGVSTLKPVRDYPIMPDPIVAMTFLSAAITTRSHLTVKNCPLEFLELELMKLEVMGQKFILKNKRKSRNGKFDVADIDIVPSKIIALPDKIYGRPFPGLNIDNLPLFVPILTQARGRTLVHDWAFENRSIYHLELQKLGAKITLLDPHRVWVEGPVKFRPNEIICPPALRPAVNVLICMLAARGRSILRNTTEIDRGYENLYEVLNNAGADIKVIND